MIRQWLRNWLGIQAIEDKLWPQPKLVSREGNRIEPPNTNPALANTKDANAPPTPEAPAIVKGYDASV